MIRIGANRVRYAPVASFGRDRAVLACLTTIAALLSFAVTATGSATTSATPAAAAALLTVVPVSSRSIRAALLPNRFNHIVFWGRAIVPVAQRSGCDAVTWVNVVIPPAARRFRAGTRASPMIARRSIAVPVVTAAFAAFNPVTASAPPAAAIPLFATAAVTLGFVVKTIADVMPASRAIVTVIVVVAMVVVMDAITRPIPIPIPIRGPFIAPWRFDWLLAIETPLHTDRTASGRLYGDDGHGRSFNGEIGALHPIAGFDRDLHAIAPLHLRDEWALVIENVERNACRHARRQGRNLLQEMILE